MPRICCCCCKQTDDQEYDKVPADDNESVNNTIEPATQIPAQHSSARVSPRLKKKNENWEQEVLYGKLLSSGLIQNAAIVSFPDGLIRGSNFAVDTEGISAVIAALQGNTESIIEGIRLSKELPLYIPGKMDPHKTIYATEIQSGGEGSTSGGCTITKVDESILIGTYDKDGIGATRLIEEMALKIEQKTHVV